MSEIILSKLKYSVLDLVTVNQGDTINISLQKTKSIAQAVEKLGYTRYWLSEHHNMPNVASSATSILIGYIANNTETIKVGSGGIMLPNHSTLKIAEEFGTLESLFPHRIDLGLGRAPGTDGRTATVLRRGQPMMDYDFEKSIEQLFQYFSKENSHASIRAIPGEGLDIPLYILGSSTDSAHLAAKLGLPYAFAGHFAPAQFALASEIYHKEFQASAYLHEPYFIACVNVVVADTADEANHLFKSHLQAVLNILSDRRGPLLPPEETELYAPSEQVRNMLLNWTSLSFVGDKESVGNGLSQMALQANVNEIMAYTNVYDLDAKLHSYTLLSELMQGL